MFVLVNFNDWSCSGLTYHQYNNYSRLRGEYSASILDTDDMTITTVKRKELEELVKRLPNIKIQGLKINNGFISQFFYDRRADYKIKNDYCLIVRYYTQGGNYCKCYLYRKGIEGALISWETPKYEYYDWEFDIEIQGKNILVSQIIDKDFKEIIVAKFAEDIAKNIIPVYIPKRSDMSDWVSDKNTLFTMRDSGGLI